MSNCCVKVVSLKKCEGVASPEIKLNMREEKLPFEKKKKKSPTLN